jgi:hypothetical protein
MLNKKFLDLYSLISLFLFSLNGFTHTLVITDSHGEGSFGDEFINLIEAKREPLSFYAVGGSTPVDWLYGYHQIWGYFEHHTGKAPIRYEHPKTPLFKELLDAHQPDRVIIELGTNLIWKEITPEDKQLIADMMNLTFKAHAKCIWIGPPDLNPKNSINRNRVLEVQQILTDLSLKNNCKLIPSWKFTHYPVGQGDGIHYDAIPFIGGKLARLWARSAFKYID